MYRNVLYVVGTGSKWQNNELRYSLRSLEKFYSPDRVYICGHKPNWVQNVTHLEFTDVSNHKLKNTNEKLKHALSYIDNDFILMNDDFYFLSKIDKLETYFNGTVANSINKHSTRSGYYFRAIQELKVILDALEIKDPLSYSLHVPFSINVTKAKEVFDIVEPLAKTGFLFRSAYGNIHNIGGIPLTDVKYKPSTWRPPASSDKFLSSDDYLINLRSFQFYIKNLFPQECSYEIV